MEVRRIKRRLTFAGVDSLLSELEIKLYDNLFIPGIRTDLSKEEILSTLEQIRKIIIEQHNGLFLHLVNNLINKIEAFGLHFASLDIRQESSIHGKILDAIAGKTDLLPANYPSLSNEEKVKAISAISGQVNPSLIEDAVLQNTLRVIGGVKEIQQYNGAEGCHRYIISQCNSALNAMEVYGLFLLSGWKREEMNIDIVPLFETIDDLKHAREVMRTLYNDPLYKQHLATRNNRQTIMLGFSDGTKDGGYLMANWSIYKAKEELTQVSKEHHIDVVFFDGRGGPPSRGGGKTHKFYASMGHNISNKEIQLTIQGQTVSSNFGIIDAAQFNIEQLLNAGITNDLFSTMNVTLETNEE
jgi:phosphoenolpyruvate carboxylase